MRSGRLQGGLRGQAFRDFQQFPPCILHSPFLIGHLLSQFSQARMFLTVQRFTAVSIKRPEDRPGQLTRTI